MNDVNWFWICGACWLMPTFLILTITLFKKEKG